MTLSADQLEDNPIFKAIACCQALNESEFLRAKISVRSATGLRFRDLAATRSACSLIVYWGVWTSERFQKGETELFGLLNGIAEIIADKLGLATDIEIILTDTHARINGVSEQVIDTCYADLKGGVGGRIRAHRLSGLLPDATPMPPMAAAMSYPGMSRILQQLVWQANKLFQSDDAQVRAERYLLANLREAPHVFRAFPTGIFIHLGQTELKAILPSMPMLIAYTGLGRETRKPWFRGRAAT